MSTEWSPAQYDKFKDERSKPFFDLLALVQPDEMDAAVDLGCGTGALTRELADRLHPRRLVGIDSSAAMLARADALTTPALRFGLGDIASYEPAGRLDLVFSNAALHWLPDHETLFPRLLRWLAPAGQLAVQMPSNFDHPSHRVAQRVAARLFPDVFSPTHRVSGTLAVQRYAEIMFANGCAEQRCRVEVYGHPLASGSDVVEWTRGSLLTAYQARLSASDFARFVEQYRRELVDEIGAQPYFFTFARILLWGRMRG